MKLIEISEIEANDDHRWDNVTLGPVTVVLALALAAQILLGLGCADTNDDPGEEQVIEEDAGIPVDAARSVAYGELALSEVMPDYIWTYGLVTPYAVGDAASWSIRSGGYNRWARTAIAPYSVGIYKSTATYATLGQPLPKGVNCVLVGSYSNGFMNCGGIAYKCPKATLVTPTAFSNGTATPDYSFPNKFNVTFKSVLAYGQFYRSGDSFRCDYPLAGASFNIVKK